VDVWDHVTLVLFSESVTCVFLPETSKVYGEHFAERRGGEAERRG
jgi:hypothetical protein